MKRSHIPTLLALILGFIMPAYSAVAQSQKAYTGKVADGYDFWLYTPDKERGSDLKPLIIFLHGASLSGSDLNRVLKYGPLDAIKRGLSLDAYVMAPQTRGGWSPRKVINDLDYVIEHNNDIDTTRIYVVGMSLGGYGSIDVANAYPDRIAAALSFCGGGTGNDFSGLSRVPIWIIHGTADRAVPISRSDAVADALRKIDANPRLIYDRVPGMNHGQPARFFYVPQFYEWLFKHSLADYGRPIAEGFKVDNSLVSGIYRRLPGSKLVTVKDSEANQQQDLMSHPFIPAGFDGDRLEDILLINEIEEETVSDSPDELE